MPRTIPVNLQTHLDEPATTTCLLMRVETADGTVLGFAGLDRSVTYDDGQGSVTYSASQSADLSAFDFTAELGVDTSESHSLFLSSAPPITPQMIRAGFLDFARFDVYQVNYEDLTQGHAHLHSGQLGRVKTNVSGLDWYAELRSWSALLKQTDVCQRGSNRCRATFGDARCGIDAEALWVTGEVESVDVDEPDRIFTDSDFAFPEAYPGPWLLQWTNGDNDGRYIEVEAYDSLTGEITLYEPMPYNISATHTFRMRPDCAKRFQEDCIAVWDNYLNFRGEPWRNVSDSGAIGTPGARVPPGLYNVSNSTE